MKTLCVLLLILAMPLVQAQERSLFLELGGSGGLGSVNYEQTLHSWDKVSLSVRAGLSFTPVDKNNGIVIGIPLLANLILGTGHWQGEVGIGQGLSITTRGQPFVLGLLQGGVRYQGEGKRFYYRMNYTPLVSYLIDFQVQHWAGLSVGYWLH